MTWLKSLNDSFGCHYSSLYHELNDTNAKNEYTIILFKINHHFKLKFNERIVNF